ncbi:MAG: hypothetical protein Ct9H300mP22_4290 [Gammaproteobacteria bacterium]|nr:MAG: hypothetical protein Ct9H300mP22_4290 [Gammaproteobacteria bacterium]
MIPEFWDDLPLIINQIDKESLARVIVISSTGPHFSAGMDTSVFGSSVSISDDPETQAKPNRLHGAKFLDTVKYCKSFTSLDNCRIPVWQQSRAAQSAVAST